MKQSPTLSTNRNTRGGQIYFHEWRMRLQNLAVVLRVSLFFALAGLVLSYFIFDLNYYNTVELFLMTYVPTQLKIWLWPYLYPALHEFNLGWMKLMSTQHVFFSGVKPIQYLTNSLTLPNGQVREAYSQALLQDVWFNAQFKPLLYSLYLVIASWLTGIGYMFYRFKRKSDQVDTEKHVRGRVVMALKKIAGLVKKNKGKPNFYISPDVPLPKGAENQHMAIFGATRMGKTNCMLGLLKQIRAKGDRAVVLDITGEMTAKFFREGRDRLINPFDQRSDSWDIWQEDLDEYEYDAWAETLVPERPSAGSDPVWPKSARKLLSYTAYNLSDQNATMFNILDWACQKPLSEQTTDFYDSSPVGSFMIPSAEKTASGVRMHLATTISAFKYLRKGDRPFSITKWIAERKHTDEWLFLTALDSQRGISKDLLSSFFSLAFLGLQRAGRDSKHRLWMVTDELPALKTPVSGIESMVTEGGKYGACCILGFQNKSQIEKWYGHDTAQTILSCCSTKVIFRSPEFATAQYLANSIGEKETVTTTESYSVGAHQVRDGVNLSSQFRKELTVTPHDIMALDEHQAYVLLPGNYPVVQVNFKNQTFDDITNGCVRIKAQKKQPQQQSSDSLVSSS